MPSTSASARADILALLAGERRPRVPAFSGLIHVTAAGLEAAGRRLDAVHHDPAALTAAAASTFQLTGLPSAAAPLDLCVEAEALGCAVDFRAGTTPPEFPVIAQPLAETLADLRLEAPADLETRGRLPVAAEAIRRLKAQFGTEIVVGAWVPGPITLLSLLLPPGALYDALGRPPESLAGTLTTVAEVLARAARLYQAAGADFITVHEMGGSPGIIGPRRFRAVALPPLQRLLAALTGPRVLSACGRATAAVGLLAEAGADAVSVDQLTDLAQARAALGAGPLLFGNLDPVATLAQGAEAAIHSATAGAIAAGADAVWPGCDLWPPTPSSSLRAWQTAAQQHPRPSA